MKARVQKDGSLKLDQPQVINKLHKETRKKVKSRDYNTRGHQYRSRRELLNINDQVQINSTTMAQWLRHCSPDTIKAQLMKLQGLQIDKLNIDYKIVDRTQAERPFLESDNEEANDAENTAQSLQSGIGIE